jgi:D-3-phosphoglycerate dehydrogenase
MKLAEQMGSFAGQITESAMTNVEIAYEGTVSTLSSKPLTQMIMASLLKPMSDSVNLVNAMQIADSRGIKISETKSTTAKDHRTLITLTITTENRTRTLAGTLFTGREPRIVNIEGVPVESALSEHMLFIRNEDKPGLIGALGTLLGAKGHNIADFHLGRTAKGESAVCLITLDAPLPDAVLADVAKLPQVKTARRLSFS